MTTITEKLDLLAELCVSAQKENRMADRTFQTCTNCGQDLSIALTHLFWRSDCPQDFEYNCKACGAVLSIEVEPLPQFWVELKQRPTVVGRLSLNKENCKWILK